MSIRDRGKLKWRAASFLPLAFEMHREMFKDQQRKVKPIIDRYEAEELDLRIAYAIEYNYEIKLSVWADGFIPDITGRIHYIDSITHCLRIEVNPGEFERIDFADVTGIVDLD